MSRLFFADALFTDLYELTMAAGYLDQGIESEACFSLFVRDLRKRNYFVAAGLESVLRQLETLCFDAEDIDYLRSTGLFRDRFLSFLRSFRFSGRVRAMEEGNLFFPEEPVMEITAPLIEAQLVETMLLNTVGLQTLIASKAARCVHAAGGRPLFDYSLRRTHGKDAGVQAARSAYSVGFSGTSNLRAGSTYGIPVSGTMAHSYVTAFGSDIRAFDAYAHTFPDEAIFLIDTFDTVEGARAAVAVAREMKKRGGALKGVRLDSGDMVALSRKVRRILDDAGLPEVQIIASSGFDEYKIAAVLAEKAPIDAFGVGTRVGVSADAPYLDVVYKMVRLGDRPVRKYSTGKVSLAGEKQVFREYDAAGRMAGDLIGLAEEAVSGAEPLLHEVMAGGRIRRPHPPLSEIRERFRSQFERLPAAFKDLYRKTRFPVAVSSRLERLQDRLTGAG